MPLLRITEMYAFAAVDPTGEFEGVCAYRHPEQGWLPMVAADAARIERLRPYAQEIATRTRRRVELLRFTVRETVEVVDP
jgi:hypothetical protein